MDKNNFYQKVLNCLRQRELDEKHSLADRQNDSDNRKIVIIEDSLKTSVFRMKNHCGKKGDKEIDWQAWMWTVGEGLATGAASWVAGRILDHYFPSAPSVVNLSQNALADIKNLVREGIADALMQDYLTDIPVVSDNLIQYHERNDASELDKAKDRCDKLLPHLMKFGSAALGGFMTAANIHLTVLLAKAESDATFRTTFVRKAAEYDDHAAPLAREIQTNLENSVGGCSCVQYGGRASDRFIVCSFGTPDGAWSESTEGTEMDGPRRSCRTSREEKYRRYVEEPVESFVNPILDTCRQWHKASRA